MDDFGGFHAGEFGVESLVLEGEALVVDAELVEHGGVEVADVDGVFDGIVAEVVGSSVDGAAIDSAAGKEHGVTLDVVVASAALCHRSASELAAPDDQCVVKQPAALEVVDEGGGALIDEFGGDCHAFFQIAVVIPAAVIELNETNAALGEATRHQAVAGEAAIAGCAAVFGDDARIFFGEIGEFGDCHLHAEGELILGDAVGNTGVIDDFGVILVELVDGFDEFGLARRGDAVGRAT